MSEDSEIDSTVSATVHAMNVDIVVERILFFLEKYPHIENILKYRLVSHKWNDVIVHKIKETKKVFKIPLRYEPHVPQFIDSSDGQRGSEEVLDTAITTLTGTAGRLPFDTLVIDRDFYLAGVMTQFKEFLEIQGQSIHHLKIKIRPGESPKENENHVMDCAEVVSMENLHDLFLATPNLKSLNFCVRFSHYESKRDRDSTVPMFLVHSPHAPRPQLKELTELKIKEPEGVEYSIEFLKSLASWAPNLKSLKIKPTKGLSNYARAIQAMSPWLDDSLTQLKIINARIDPIYSSFFKGIREFSNLPCLTSLTLNKISGLRKFKWIRSLLLAYQFNLKVLNLGQEKLNYGDDEDWSLCLGIDDEDEEQSLFPPVMENLEDLEINLTEFSIREHVSVESYGTRFPRLSTLRITGCVQGAWSLDQLNHMLPCVPGQSQTLQLFNLVGNFDTLDEKIYILFDVSETFPMANIEFDFQ